MYVAPHTTGLGRLSGDFLLTDYQFLVLLPRNVERFYTHALTYSCALTCHKQGCSMHTALWT